jgi:polysaccharide export outer membrane protein
MVGHAGGFLPREGDKQALPPYVIEPPDILLIEATPSVVKPTQPVSGSHLVRPDGTVGLGVYGSVFVAGLTIEQARWAVAQQLAPFTSAPKDMDGVQQGKPLTPEQVLREVRVDVIAYNSKVYYVITDGGGYGAQIYRLPSTGNETVLDALAQVQGLPAVASKKKIWVARAANHGAPPSVLPVDYCSVVLRGQTDTNYQIYPGDRIYVGSDPRIVFDSQLAKFLNPIERGLGAVLLGSGVVNSIQGRFGSTGTGR